MYCKLSYKVLNHTKDLYLIETFCIVNNVINFWKTSLNKKSNFKQNYEERKRFNKVVDFTLSNKEFTALGHTRLFTSTSGEIKKIKNRYDVNILVLIQYRDTFDDVGNIFTSGSQKNPRKELDGGNPFGMETRIKTIRIRKTMKSLDEIKKEVEDN